MNIKKANERLSSRIRIELKKRRYVDAESVFGHIKSNRGFDRFVLRVIEKVSLEWGLISITHNFRKVWTELSLILIFARLIEIYKSKKLRNEKSCLFVN